jgi:hypothetical protein
MSLTKVSNSMCSSAPVSVLDKGADNTGSTNSSAAFTAAILQVALSGGGKVVAPFGTYLLTSTVILPSNVELDFCNSIVNGPGIGSATDLFQTGYLSGGAVVTNIGSSPETHLVTHAAVKNATINNCGKAFNLYNFVDNCELNNIKFNDCGYAVYAARCFYARFVNLFCRGAASGATTAAFYFYDFVNVCQIESVFAQGRVLGIEVIGGANGQVLLNCSAESCTTGIKVNGENGPLKIDTCYFESCSSIGLDLYNSGNKIYVTVENSWFAFCGTAIKGGLPSAGSTIFVHENNRFYTCTTLFDGADNYTSFGKVEIPPVSISDNAYPSIPSGYTIGKKYRLDHENIIFDSTTGEIVTRTKVHGPTIIAFENEGNAGSTVANKVAFCEHSKTAGTTFSVVIDTKINYETKASLVVYRLEITDNLGAYQFYGFVFGDQVKQLDANSQTIAVSNNGGYVRLTIGTFFHPSSTYGCQGIIRHI